MGKFRLTMDDIWVGTKAAVFDVNEICSALSFYIIRRAMATGSSGIPAL
jgi:hypothetical protein